MLDMKFVSENPSVVKNDLKKREETEKVPWVDEVIEKWQQWKDLKIRNDKLRRSRNAITREINELRKAGRDFKTKIKEAKELLSKLSASDKKLQAVAERINYIMVRLPNILHDSVPAGKDGNDNKVVKKWGTPKKDSKLKSHGELLEEKGLADFERAAEMSGSGFYFLKGDLVRLEMALAQFAVDEVEKRGFILIAPPAMLRRKPYEGVVAIQDFEDVMYKIADEDNYLIATSEHILAAMHTNDVFGSEQLPLKYCGISPCFRKEIGSHGVDTRGLFRVHQFNKVEMFVFCRPEESWRIHEELLKINEEIIQKLKMPYRVVNVCTGDLGIIAAKKYDVEAWYPRQNKYREIISTSNCTDYQANAKNIRFVDKDGNKKAVHTLNATAIATSRIMVAIAENNQNPDGSINVPAVLQKYVGKKVIGK